MIAEKMNIDDNRAYPIKGKNVVVVGMGATGVSVCKFLCERGAIVSATDVKRKDEIEDSEALEKMGVRFSTGKIDGNLLSTQDLAIVSPGVTLELPEIKEARRSGVTVIRDIELASWFLTKPIVAIAGTNGKSTVTTLIGEMLRQSGKEVFVGGNIGTPAVEGVRCDDEVDAHVLELSSFHLEAVERFNPKIGVLLNITEDHMDRYDSFSDYASTKFKLFMNQSHSDIAVVNAGDPVITEDMGEVKGKVIPFSTKCFIEEGLYLNDEGNIVFDLDGVMEIYPSEGAYLKGLQNTENIMASIAVARSMGVAQDSILKVLESFKGLPHRMECVREVDGVSFINDSKATNAGAVIKALCGITSLVVLIAGGRDKGGEIGELKETIGRKVKCVVAIGEAGKRFKDEFSDVTEVINAGTMEDAVRKAKEMAKKGDVVLLSPACASFDMFNNFEERGNEFKRVVQELK